MVEYIFNQYSGVPPVHVALEIIAVCFGLASVLLAKRTNILVYPTGIVSTLIYIYLLWVNRLLGDMLINAYYTIMSIYGWVMWSKNSTKEHKLIVGKVSGKDNAKLVVLAISSWLFVMAVYYLRPYIENGFSMQGVALSWSQFKWTDYTDAFTTAIFLVGMWLMAKAKIENWIYWIVGDAISVPLYMYKGLAFSSLQYAVFTIIAIKAYFQWKEIYFKAQAQ